MKIAILGYSGSGKSTLARAFARKYGLPLFHFDTVQFLPHWVIRDKDERTRMTKDFMDTHSDWVMDGNYARFFFERRMEEADVIVLLLFNRFSCLWRAWRRSRVYKNRTRPDMAAGCNEKFDLEFIKWILYEGRSRETRARFRQVLAQYPDKVIVLKNQKKLNQYINKERLE